MNTDLSLVSTDDLWKELTQRYVNLVLVGEKKTNEKGNLDFYKFGTANGCLGLVQLASRYILREYGKKNKEDGYTADL